MKWTRFASRQGVDLPTLSGFDPYFFDLVWRFSGKKGELFFTFLKEKNFTHYIAVDSHRTGLAAFRHYFNSPGKIKRYYNEGKEFIKEFEDSSGKWGKKISKNPENKMLLAAFREFRGQFKRVCGIYSIISFFAIEVWQEELDTVISRLIEKNRLSGERDSIIACLYKPWKKTAIIEIQEKIAKKEKPGKLVKEYQFLRSWSLVWYHDIDEGWVKGLTKPKTEKQKYSLEKAIEILRPSKDEEKLLRLAPYVIFFKDWRDDLRRKFSYYWSFLFEKISGKFGIEYDDLGYLTLDEMEQSLKKDIINTEIIRMRRKHGCIVTSQDSGWGVNVVDRDIPTKYLKIIEDIEKQVNEIEIKGLAAQPGKIRGKVIIMASYHDIKKVKDGDILVANTTHPNYLPAMQRAAAFVTNEGGVVSHAAIVAREMKKPCIVGTRNATKVLNDGDFVEVDANKGIVRKLKTKD